MAELTAINPPGWPPPRGYANGLLTAGQGERLLFVAGQVGWRDGVFEHSDFVGQFGQALANVLAVVRAAGGAPTDIARMTVYVTDLDAYRRSLRELGTVWKSHMERHFPVMALVGVAGLVERAALVEIEATAVLSQAPGDVPGDLVGPGGSGRLLPLSPSDPTSRR